MSFKRSVAIEAPPLLRAIRSGSGETRGEERRTNPFAHAFRQQAQKDAMEGREDANAILLTTSKRPNDQVDQF